MSLRAKTKRRLVILLVTSVAIAAGGGGYVALRISQLRAAARHAGDIGLTAAKAGDYETALPNLGKYLGRFPEDPDALYYCAIARQQIETPDHRNLLEAAGYYRRALELGADKEWNIDARRRLLKLYAQINYNAEAIDAADALMNKVPHDKEAMYYKAVAQFHQQSRDALDTIRACNERYPQGFDNHYLEIFIRQQSGAKPEELVDLAEGWVKKQPDDPGLRVLLSMVYTSAGKKDAAKAVATAVMGSELVTFQAVSMLALQLDSLEMFPEALAVLTKGAEKHPADLEYQRALAVRLIEGQAYDQFNARWGSLDAARPESDEQLLALKGMALALQGKMDEARSVFDALEKRPARSADSAARAMVAAARATWFNNTDPKARVEACRKALDGNLQNPFLHYLMGEACDAQRNLNTAAQEWRIATMTAPAWGLPYKRLATLLLDARQASDALEAARSADLRLPGDEEINVTLVAAMAGTTDSRKTADVNKLLTAIEETRSRFPKAESLRPLLVNVQAVLNQKDKAIAEGRAILALQPPASEETLLNLEQISYQFKLGLEEDCFNTSQQAHGLTPKLGYAKAVWLFNEKRAPEGLALLEAQATKPDASVDWRIHYTRYLEQVNDPRTKDAWIALARSFSTDTSVQWAALEAPSVQGEKKFLAETIDRLIKQSDKESVEGRLAQALFLLEDSDPGTGKPKDKQTRDKQTAEASLILSDITRSAPNLLQVRALLAECLRQLGNVSGAIEQLRIVENNRPEDLGIALRLAAMLIDQGDTNAARDQLGRVAQYQSSPGQRQMAAKYYVQLGDQDRAAQLLEKDADATASLMMAQLYIQKRQFDKAEAICRTLMENPSADVIRVYVQCLGFEGKKSEAEAALAKLDSLKLDPGIREAIRAEYLSNFGKPEDALAQYVAAAAAAPQNQQLHQQLLIFCLRTGKFDDVAAHLRAARTQFPNDEGFSALDGLMSQLRQIGGDAQMRALFIALLQSPKDIPALKEAIQLASAAMQKPPTVPVASLAPKVRQLADANPKVYAIQTFAIGFLNAVGQFDDSVAMSTRAMAQFPNSSDAARLATESLGNARRWNEMIAAAKEWREREPGDAIKADLAIAGADLELRSYDAAMRQLEPYLERAKAAPVDYAPVLMFYTQGLLATKQTNRAAQLIQPFLSQQGWHSNWIGLAAAIPDAAARAAWLEQVAPLIPADMAKEKIQLATAYEQLAVSTGDAAYRKKAHALFEPIAASPSVEPGLLYTIGMLYESEKDPANAEKMYARVLIAAPNHPGALNNLAMILANADRDLDKALDYATRAVKIAPAAACYDTLANVYAHQKSYRDALQAIGQALTLEPHNPEWQATRIWILALEGNAADARSALQNLRDAKAVEKLSDFSRERLKRAGLI